MTVRLMCLAGVLLVGTPIYWFTSPPEPEGGEAVELITSPLSRPASLPRISEPPPVTTHTDHKSAAVQAPPKEEGAGRELDLADIDYRPLLAQGKVTKSELALILSSFDDAQLLQFLLNNTHLTQDDFFSYQNPTETLRTLVERWLNDTEPFSPQDGVELLFGTRSSIGTDQLGVLSEFSHLNPSLYAYYRVPEGYSKSFVFLKWSNTSGDMLWQVDKQPLTGTPAELQEGWLRYSNGWPPGEYQVEVISAEEGLEVLASKSFQVYGPDG